MYGKTSLFGLVSVLAVALPSVNAYATTGCFAAGAVTQIIQGALTIPTTQITSPADCAARSTQVNRAYAYWDGNTNICYSTNLEPLLTTTFNTVGTLLGGVGQNVCGANQLQGLDVNTPYTDFGCALPVDTSIVNAALVGANPLSISDCLESCQANGYRFSVVNTFLIALNTCRCSQAVRIINQGICGLGRNYIYVNTAIAPTGVARKREIEMKKRMEIVGHCPSGLSACRVNQGEFATNDFECLDVQAELESCGGCTAGIVDGDASLATSGVDCTAIPGVEMGAVSCRSGQCEISACKRGYALIDNVCVSTRSVASMALGALRLQNL